MKETVPPRRRFLRTLVGTDVRERLAHERLVENVCELLRERHVELAFGVSEDELPAPKEKILEAFRIVATSKRPPLPRAALREAYASLGMFCDEETLSVVREAKADLDAQNFDEDGQRRIQVGFARRTVLIQERVRLEKEFDAFLREHPGEDSEDSSHD